MISSLSLQIRSPKLAEGKIGRVTSQPSGKCCESNWRAADGMCEVAQFAVRAPQLLLLIELEFTTAQSVRKQLNVADFCCDDLANELFDIRQNCVWP